MILQKITSIFLAVVLVTGAITLGTSALIDDAFASGDKYKKENHDREYDSYDNEPKNKKHDSYKIEYPKDKKFVIVFNNNLYNNFESAAYPDYTDKNSYEPTADYGMKDDKKYNSYESDYGKDKSYNRYEPTADYGMKDDKKYNSYESEHIEYNNEYEYNPIDYK